MLIGADTPVAWLEANNVRFVERPHLYTLGASDEVVRRMVPDATECPKSVADSLALLVGTQHAPARPSKHRVRDVVGQLRSEIRHAVDDLSGVFKISDLQRVRTPARGVTANVIPAQRLARSKTTGVSRVISASSATSVPRSRALRSAMARARPARARCSAMAGPAPGSTWRSATR